MSRLTSLFSDCGRIGVRPAFQALWARYSGRPVSVLDVGGGRRFHVRGRDSDVSAFRQVFGHGEYRIKTPEVQARLTARYEAILALGQVPVVIDAGANVGAASLWFHDLYPKARVLSVEPDAGNAALLRLNTERHPEIAVVEAAIGARSGHVALTGQGQGWGVRTERSETGLPVVTVADLKAMVPNGVLFLVKVDIEGFEEDLFGEAVDWLDEAFCVIVEPHDWMLPERHTSRTFQHAMGQRVFQMLIQGENLIYVRPPDHGRMQP